VAHHVHRNARLGSPVLIIRIWYKSDRDDARSSAKAVARALLFFLDYLRKLTADQMCQARLNLMAHSMGNYVLRNAVQAIISELGGKRLPRAFTNIFLMAADEDDDALSDPAKLARLPEMAEAVHVYFAASDRALTISDITKGNPDRLGSAGPHTLTNLPQKITLIDCDQVCQTTLAEANHQYYRKRPEVVADVGAVLDGVRPEDIAGRTWVPARGAFVIAAKG
jgi:esterase/lipase superfamily enzyme